MAVQPLMPLRPYQEQAIASVRIAVMQADRALLVMPTGSGKTVVFSEICRLAREKKRKVLILVHRRELIKQASDKLKKAGVRHGIIASGFNPSRSPVQVASVQTLIRRLNTSSFTPDLIIIDEAHHAVAGSWDKDHFSLRRRKNHRCHRNTKPSGRRGLGSHFSTLVSGPSVAQLTKLGFLSPHRVFAPPVIADLSNVKTRAGDYANDELSAAMDRPQLLVMPLIPHRFALTVYLLLLSAAQ